MEPRPNQFLKVTGILMIIGGALGIILGIIAVLAASAASALFGAEANALFIASIFMLVSSVISLIAGILGVANAKRPEKAMICIVFGILTVLFSLLGNVITVANGGEFNVAGLITGLVLPVLYLIGAFQSKKSMAPA